MPNFECEQAPVILSNSDHVAFVERRYYTLRRLNQAGDTFDPAGLCAPYGIVMFPARRIAKLSELVGFIEGVDYQADADGNPLGSVLWRVSSDGGAHWDYYDGAAWVTKALVDVTNDDFGTMRDMDIKASTYPKWDANNFIWCCKIIPDATRKFSPKVSGAAVQGEVFAFDIEELHASVQAFITNNLRAPLWTRETVAAATPTKVVVRTTMNILSVVGCYNEGTALAPNTTTPRHNIFGSISGNEITLVGGPYAAGTLVRVEFRGRPSPAVFTSVDTEFYSAKVPAILLEMPSVGSARAFSNHQIQDVSPNRDLVRERRAPERVYLRFHIKVKTSRKASADGIAQGLRELFETTPCYSAQDGARMRLWNLDFYRNTDNQGANVFQRDMDVVYLATIHGGNPYTTYHKVKEIAVGVALDGDTGPIVDADAVVVSP